MLRVPFILAALLAAEGVVFAHPIDYVRRNGFPSTVARAVPDNDQAVSLTRRRSLLEDLYGDIVGDMMQNQEPHTETSATAVITPEHDGNQNQLGIRGHDIDDVETRDFSDLEDLETRVYWSEDEEKLERRELDDESTKLMARESNGGELDARDFDDGARVLAPRNHYYGPTRRHGHGRRRQSYQSSFYMNPNARDFDDGAVVLVPRRHSHRPHRPRRPRPNKKQKVPATTKESSKPYNTAVGAQEPSEPYNTAHEDVGTKEPSEPYNTAHGAVGTKEPSEPYNTAPEAVGTQEPYNAEPQDDENRSTYDTIISHPGVQDYLDQNPDMRQVLYDPATKKILEHPKVKMVMEHPWTKALVKTLLNP